ncbi:MAG TPA: adenosylcobinamide-GDP ribazoletransferase [Methylocystis sp.]|nr:adenosylcobinamide-GDP ribazoletransferase [Methylocystis sp.]
MANSWLTPLLEDLFACLRFYSRLDVPGDASGALRFPAALRALPLAGAIIGGCGAVALLCARAAGVPPLPAAACAIAALVAVTGALHEDGLADVADGFGGGATRERRLEIMRDSRLGSFGGAALTLALTARVAAVGALAERGLWLAMLALVATGAVSRVAGLAPLVLLAPARRDGSGAAVARPDATTLRTALALSGLVAAPLLFAGLSLLQVLAAGASAVAAALYVTRLSSRHIGGFTGDTLGCAQQAAEIACLLALCAR